MIFHPGVLALLVCSFLGLLMIVYAACFAVQILRHWDLNSGSERQLQLERKTYLVSTVVSYVLGLQLVSLFLFLYTVDDLHFLFVGAMCAVGSLTVNGYGYPTLFLKLATFLLAALWLILNHADGQGYDYPLIRSKQKLFLVLAPVIMAEFACQSTYFLTMQPDIITSCCGSLFSVKDRSLATEMINAPPLPVLALFFASTGATLAAGIRFLKQGGGAILFASLSGLQFPVAIAATVSVLSLYVYEMPSHHCPFCILQQDYLFVGYPLYLSLLTAVASGLGVGLLERWRKVPSLAAALPIVQRQLASIALVALIVMIALSIIIIGRSSLTLR